MNPLTTHSSTTSSLLNNKNNNNNNITFTIQKYCFSTKIFTTSTSNSRALNNKLYNCNKTILAGPVLQMPRFQKEQNVNITISALQPLVTTTTHHIHLFFLLYFSICHRIVMHFQALVSDQLSHRILYFWSDLVLNIIIMLYRYRNICPVMW